MAKKQTITTAEAAEMLGLAERTVQKLCQDGTIRAERGTRSWSVEKVSVKELIKERQKALKAAQKAKKARAK